MLCAMTKFNLTSERDSEERQLGKFDIHGTEENIA